VVTGIVVSTGGMALTAGLGGMMGVESMAGLGAAEGASSLGITLTWTGGLVAGSGVPIVTTAYLFEQSGSTPCD
jgi:hypothetical protein